jgi:hypothetical protein
MKTWSPAGKFAAATSGIPTNITYTIDFLKHTAMELSFTLTWALEFMVLLSFWGNLKWKHPITTVWYLVFGTLDQAFRRLIPSENKQCLIEFSSLVGVLFGIIHNQANITFKFHEDPDLLGLSASVPDEKLSKVEV